MKTFNKHLAPLLIWPISCCDLYTKSCEEKAEISDTEINVGMRDTVVV